MSDNFFNQSRFLPYFCTQFLGVFNDSLYKNILAIFIAYRLVLENEGLLLNIAAIIFILPFFLFGALAGQLADKYEKSFLIRRIKVMEMIIISVGCIALYLQSINMMLVVLFALGTQSAFFGPIKYSILPQHLHKDELLRGNAYVEAGTFIGLLVGTTLGGFLASESRFELALIALLISVAVLGWLASRKIPAAQPSAPNLRISFNVWQSTIEIIKEAQKNKPVFKSILVISWFWFFGSIILTQFPSFTENVLYGDAKVATVLLATFSVGIGLGSIACSMLSGDRVDVGIMPVGALGISIFTWQFSNAVVPASNELRTLAEMLATPGIWSVIFNMAMISFSCGLFIVPMYTFMQVRSDEKKRSRVIAVNNIINAIFMVAAGALAALMISLEFSVLSIFKVVAILNLLVTVYILYVVPEFFLRLISWILVHSIYRISKKDLHNIPDEGSALLVCNHVSFFDPMLIFAMNQRPIRFVMHDAIYDMPGANFVFKALKAIPISSRRKNPERMQEAFDLVAQALENGELICIFPEGGITRDGEIAKFQSGVEHILKRTPVSVIPLAIRGLWGTWFSRHKGRAMKGFPMSYMKKISVVSGEAISPEIADRHYLFEQVAALRGSER